MLTFIRTFLRDETGVAGPIIALSMMSLISATGASIDYARAQMVQTKLADTLDAAGLAAGATLSSQDSTDVAQNYFDVNFPQGFMNAAIDPLSVNVNDTKSVLTLSASAKVPTIFMGIVGINEMDVSASTEITRKSGGLEVVLVLDNTGSMAGQKLTDLKTSSTELINILFGDDATKEKLWVGVIPFSQAVNIGTGYSSWMDTTYNATLNWHGVPWSGCVDARSGSYDQTDDLPSLQKFKSYYWKDDSNNDWLKSNGSLRSGIGPDLGPNRYCPQRLLEMTNVKADILDAIEDMAARGNTHVNLGAAWGWRMLSPNWRGMWGGAMGVNNLPLDYGTEHMTKVMILMTDGDNTMSSTVRSAYGYLSEGKLGTTNASAAVTQLNNRLTTTCTSMKSHGIKIYSIMFNLNSSSVRTLFKGCASDEDYFFESATSDDLLQAFRQIGDSLSNLRISK
jgi:Flp pilus assembly protein TadG